MTFGDLNFVFMIFFIILVSIVVNVNTSLHLLLTAEFLWISLYIISLFVGFIYDNLNILSLTFFYLILSAVEFGLGLIIILIQNIINRSISLSDNSRSNLKLTSRYQNKLYINNIHFL